MILDPSRPPVLETERLRLAPLTVEDAAAIFPPLGDPDVLFGWDAPEPDDPDMVGHAVQGQVDAMAAGREMHWTLRTLAGEAYVGCVGLGEIDRRHRRADMGFMLGRDAWREDYGREAMTAVLTQAAGSGLRRLSARTRLGARRQEAMLEQFGFEEEGLVRGGLLEDGERRDCRRWRLLL